MFLNLEIINNLNPKINDLFENNVYKLSVNEDMYIVPLWHNELHFSTKNDDELIVLCNPTLPDNISIDENNNIIIDYDWFKYKRYCYRSTYCFMNR